MHVSLVGSHGFTKGPLDPENHEFCIEKLREGIDVAVEFGMQERDHVHRHARCRASATSRPIAIASNAGSRSSRYAEEKGINLCLEHLNTRDNTHPMKGIPAISATTSTCAWTSSSAWIRRG